MPLVEYGQNECAIDGVWIGDRRQSWVIQNRYEVKQMNVFGQPSVASNLQEKLPGSVRVHDRTGTLHNQMLSHPLP